MNWKAIGAGLGGGLIFGPKIYNVISNPYDKLTKGVEKQYSLADLQGQRDLQSQLARSNRVIGARLASLGTGDPTGYAGQAASDTMFRSLADLRTQLSKGKAAALADLAERGALFNRQAWDDLSQSLINAGTAAISGGAIGGPQLLAGAGIPGAGSQIPNNSNPNLISQMRSPDEWGDLMGAPRTQLPSLPSAFSQYGSRDPLRDNPMRSSGLAGFDTRGVSRPYGNPPPIDPRILQLLMMYGPEYLRSSGIPFSALQGGM